MLTRFDEEEKPVGTVPRSVAHREGILHEVVHCWVVSKTPEGIRCWFQQRAHTKKDFPDDYDITVGGHIAAGEDRLTALLREIREEIGLYPSPEALTYLGDRRAEIRVGDFFDREIARVYLLRDDCPAFCPGEEVEKMIWVSPEEFIKKELLGEEVFTAHEADGTAFLARTEEFCIHPGEFAEMVLPRLGAMAD